MKRIKRWILIAGNAKARIVERLGTGRNTRILEPYRFDADVPLCRELPCECAVQLPDELSYDAIPLCRRPCSPETKFACKLADLLRERSTEGDFDRLLIVAPPSMIADLHASFDDGMRVKVIAELAADLTKVANVEIVHRLETENLLC